jgi:hypothetical protein
MMTVMMMMMTMTMTMMMMMMMMMMIMMIMKIMMTMKMMMIIIIIMMVTPYHSDVERLADGDSVHESLADAALPHRPPVHPQRRHTTCNARNTEAK